MAIDFDKAFLEAKTALKQLDAQVANIEEELRKRLIERDAVVSIYNAVAPMIGKPKIPRLSDALMPPPSLEIAQDAGISVATRSVLDGYPGEDFTAAQMRSRLEKHGWDWADYKNPLSTVHTTLVRLAQSGAAKETTTSEGTKAFHSFRRVEPGQLLKDLGTAAAATNSITFAPDSPLLQLMKGSGTLNLKSPEAAITGFLKMSKK